MSSGPSLYRRHRPRTFADVVGQEHVVRTLSHAVQQDNIHHAYLFVGSRGTGKTSMAKILASCLNCVNGPTITPCGVCDSCVSIANATSLDVIEMDAASNNSVDDIRELRDKVAYAPVSGRHKVYILDEAHMLSTQAWNAFLKTLEEPPPRTVFVLATTEARKVLPTVVDRCHRFDFGRPSAEQVAEVLRRVSKSESIAIDEGAIALIARSATGSFRDALGTLEQLLTYVGGVEIKPDDVLAVLGIAGTEQLAVAVDAVIARDPASALRAASALTGAGRDPSQILRDLETHVDDLLTVQILGEVPEQVRVTADRDAALLAQAQRLAPADATRLLELVVAALAATAGGAQARIQLELALVKAAAPEIDPSVSALMARVQRLERAGVAVAAPAAAAAIPAAVPPPAPPAAASPPPPSVEVPAPAPPDAATAPEPAPAAAPPTPVAARPVPNASGPAKPATAPPRKEEGFDDFGPLPEFEPEREFDPEPEPAPKVVAQPAQPVAAPQPPQPPPPPAEPASPATPEPPTLQIVPSPPASPPPPAATPAAGGANSPLDLDLAQIRALWPAVVDAVRAGNAMLAVLLDGATPNEFRGGELSLAFAPENDFYRRKAEREENRRATIDAIRAVTGTTLSLRFVLAKVATTPAAATPAAAAPVKLSEDEVVQRLIDDFGASEIPDPDQEVS